MEGATPALSLAVVERDGRVRARMRFDQGESHSRLLPGVLDELLAQAGVGLEDLSGVAVGIGPGAFTGLRVILATAKGIAYARKLPLIGVSTLEALARGARGGPSGASLVPLLDARKQEVYAGFYRREGERLVELAPKAALSPKALVERLEDLPTPWAIFGEGYRAHRELIDEGSEGRRVELPDPPRFPDAVDVAALAFEKGLEGANLFTLEPDYLRRSDAELGWTRQTKSSSPTPRRGN